MSLQPVKRLKREINVKGNVLTLYTDTVEVNGLIEKWDYLHHNGAGAVIPVTEDGKILMVRQYRNALDRFTLEIPAGKVDSPDEPRIECALRELEEETGYKTESLEFLIRVDTFVAFCNEEIDVFIARNLIKTKQNLDEDEAVEVEEWGLDELLDMVYKGELKDAKTISAILAYANKYGK